VFFEHLDLNLIWFILVGGLFTGYAILDGFDLGVGALHLLTNTDEERRLMLNSIGPVWDGNEVWLVTGGGALFAAFPDVYATSFSGFYLAFMLLLVMLIFRAVAIEFRSKQPMRWWRKWWDISFSVSSILGALIQGIALGNVAQGVPLGADHEFHGSFLGLFNPYALLVGVTTLAMFAMHATIYVVLKTEGALQAKAQGWLLYTLPVFVMLYIATTMVTLLYVPQMTDHVFCAGHWQHAGRGQHSPRNLPWATLSGVYLVLPDHRVHDGPLRAGRVSLPVAVQPALGVWSAHLQRRLIAENTGDYADYRPVGHAAGAFLHHQRVLDFPGEGEADFQELLAVKHTSNH